MRNPSPHKILAVASAGGHWIQLLRLQPAFDGHKVFYITTLQKPDDCGVTQGASVSIVRDASRTDKIGLVFLLAQLLLAVLKIRPTVVITTGAAPGLLALRIGKLFGARTIWIDSIANIDELSLSGRLAEPYADLWLTQWPHLVGKYTGLQHFGAVL